MNSTIRDELKEIYSQLDGMKARLEGIRDDEQEEFDELGDDGQQNKQGQIMESNIDCMSEAIEHLESALANLDTVDTK
jgi:hypothetical protein